MDPSANLALIVDHLSDGEINEAENLAADHLDWITRTGFLADNCEALLSADVDTETNTHLAMLRGFYERHHNAA